MPVPENDDILNAEFLIESKRPTRKLRRKKSLPVTDFNLADVNELITNGREDLLVYTVTGYSSVFEIKVGDLVFVDPSRKAFDDEIGFYELNGKTYVHKYVDKGFVVVAHLAIYDKSNKAG